MSKSFVIGDLHFGHKAILKYRPQFADVTQHDSTIMHNIKTTCCKRDTLWLLGDCFFSWESITFAKEIANHVGFINWVLGNHDTDNSERQKVLRAILGCGYIHQIHSLTKYKSAWLSHAPIHPDELRGKINIHGHTHSHVIDDERYVGVSCEQIDFTPMELASIL